MFLKNFLQQFLLLLILLATSFIACKKDENSGDGSVIKGVISLRVHAVHHYLDVPGIGVYMKTNASVFPGSDTTLYEYKARADHLSEFRAVGRTSRPLPRKTRGLTA